MNTIETLKETFQLEPHPEGGYYKRHYQSTVMVPTARGLRHATSNISYLLSGEDFSAFHRIQSDETWTYHQGTTELEIYELTGSGMETRTLGPNSPILTVPPQTWFAARPKSNNKTDYVLCSCVVSPGFDFNDFEMADRNELIQQFPGHLATIQALTREAPVVPIPTHDRPTDNLTDELTVETLVIMTAMDMEGDFLARELNLQPLSVAPFSRYGVRCFHRNASGIDIYLVINPGCRDSNNQIGTIAAAQATTLVLEHLNPDLILSAGVAGAYTDGPYNVGDVIYATNVMLHGHQIPLESLSSFGQTIYSCTRFPKFEETAQVKLGTLSSGNEFLTALQRASLEQSRQADIEDMEAAAIAQVLNGLPSVHFVCLKAITNLTGVTEDQEQVESTNFDDNLTKALTSLGKQVSNLMQHFM